MSSPDSPKYPVVVPGVGPIPAPGMILGEAPGRNEIEQGIPFCGRSGEVLDAALAVGGSRRDEWYITNIYKGDVGIGNRNPTSDEISAHWDILREEIQTVRPKGILLLGRVAGQAFIPNLGRMADHIGHRIPSVEFPTVECWLDYHPAYVLRNPEALTDFQETVIKFVLTTRVLNEYIRD